MMPKLKALMLSANLSPAPDQSLDSFVSDMMVLSNQMSATVHGVMKGYHYTARPGHAIQKLKIK